MSALAMALVALVALYVIALACATMAAHEHDEWMAGFKRRCKADDDAWEQWKRDFEERCWKDRGES